MLVRVISDLELGRPGPRNADTAVGSLVVGKEQVDRHWSDPLAVGCQPTPGLSSQDFPLAALQVHEIEPEATSMRVTSLADAGSIVAAECFTVRSSPDEAESPEDPSPRVGTNLLVVEAATAFLDCTFRVSISCCCAASCF